MKDNDLTKRLARVVGLYIEWVWPHVERAGGTPDEPMQAAKGSTNPPFGDYTHRIIDSNRVASDYLYVALEETSNCGVRSSEGVYFSDVARALRYNPGLLNDWRDKDERLSGAFKEMCLHVARGVLYLFRRTKAERDEMRRRLDLHPDDSEALVVRRHPEDELESKGRTRRGQRIDTMHTRRLMVEQLEQIERAYPDCTTMEVMEILSERKAKEGKEWSVAKIRKARETVNREREGEVA